MPQRPSFFYDGQLQAHDTVTLDPDTAKHIWQVLRMEPGDGIILTDGKGNAAEARIHTAERHLCSAVIENVTAHPRQGHLLHLAVAFTKNNSRNEWLLEKATELGVASIIPLNASRSEKTHVRNDRWHKILQAAILQSQQYHLPVLQDVMPISKLLDLYKDVPQKMVAHCIAAQDNAMAPGMHRRPLTEMLNPGQDALVLIGPEGDFTVDEVNLCIAQGCNALWLGSQRLRTETAAITVAAYFNLVSDAKN